MKTSIIVSFFCLYTSIIFGVTPTPSPRALRKHHSGEPDKIEHNVIKLEDIEKEPQDSEKDSEFAPKNNDRDFLQEVIEKLHDIPQRSSSEESIVEEKPTVSTLSYVQEIDLVAQHLFEKYHTKVVTDYPKTASWLFVSLNPKDENIFTIAGHKELYIYSADTGECKNKANPITFEKPIVKTDFVQDNILQVAFGEQDCVYIDLDSKEKVVYTSEITNTNKLSRHINLNQFDRLQITEIYDPTIWGKRLITGKKKCISVKDDPFIHIQLHDIEAFKKDKKSLESLILEKEPIILKVFKQWKANKPCPSEFFTSEDATKELLEDLEEVNDIYIRYQPKKSNAKKIAEEPSSTSDSEENSKKEMSPPPSYKDSYFY